MYQLVSDLRPQAGDVQLTPSSPTDKKVLNVYCYRNFRPRIHG